MTAYEMRISDWSSDVCSSDLVTGEERWRFDPKVPDDAIPYTAACRGVSYYDARIAAAPAAIPARSAAPDDAGSRQAKTGGAEAAAPAGPVDARAAKAVGSAVAGPGATDDAGDLAGDQAGATSAPLAAN